MGEPNLSQNVRKNDGSIMINPDAINVPKIDSDFPLLKSLGFTSSNTSLYLHNIITEIEKFKIKDFEGLNILFAENKTPVEL